MNQITQAMQELGLSGPAVGTTEQDPILEKLEELSEIFTEHEDLFIEAAEAVRSGRSAGTETIDDNSVFAARRTNTVIHLRYRNEMVNVFTDLMIDLALRGAITREVPNVGQEIPAPVGTGVS